MNNFIFLLSSISIFLPLIAVYFAMFKKEKTDFEKDNQMHINKEEFYVQAKKFFDEGLLREIYSTDRICICNACNAFYIVFNYTITESGPIGIVIEQKYIEGTIDADAIEPLGKVLGPKLEEACGFLNNKSYDYLKGVRAETDEKGPYVDLEYEKEISDKLKLQNRLK